MTRLSNVLFGGTALALLAAIAPAGAQVMIPEDKAVDELVITAMRFDAPRATVPSTIQIIGANDLRLQQALAQSAVEVVSALVPSFSPTRQKLSGTGRAPSRSPRRRARCASRAPR